MTLLDRVRTCLFDDDLIEEIIMDSSQTIVLAAVSRSDCPPELLVDLSQNLSPIVRAAVARHANLPVITRERMKKDPDTTVSFAAKGYSK